MLELGQPMHVFDADTLSGSLIVRRAAAGETLACLNEKTVTLQADTLVVADEVQALSMAGLMGGSASAVHEATRHIVLECAWFAPAIIAGKARQYGFGSDSSFRYERGVDYALQQQAIERASVLIAQICGGRCGPVTEALGNLPSVQQVPLRLARAEKLLGVPLQSTQVETMLRHLGLQPQATAAGFDVTAPSFRFDIAIEADVIEEIGRVYGYENIPDQHTSGRLAMIKLPETRQTRFDIYRQMAARGYQEVVSYAFVDEAWERDFAANSQPIRLQNPIASHMSVMRSTLFGGLVEVLQNNLNRKQNRVRVFEVARVFHKNNDAGFSQTEKIGGLAYGLALPEQWGESSRQIDFYDVKADIEALLGRQAVRFQAASHPALHPGRTAAIMLGDEAIGIIGELHPKWLQQYDLPQAPLLFEVNFDTVLQRDKVRYQPQSKFQPVRRDLAFVLPEATTAQTLLDALAGVNNPRIRQISLFDVYRGTGLPEGMKSIAVNIQLQDQDATLTDADVDAIVAALIEAAGSAGAQLRG